MRKPYADVLKELGPPPRPDIPQADRASVPPRTLWFRRPVPWSGGKIAPTEAAVPGQVLAEKLSLYHDGSETLPAVSQPESGGLAITAQGFDGSFLSLAFGMTREEVRGIHEHDLIRMTARLTVSPDLRIYARLVLLSGPNREEVPREIPLSGGGGLIEWDLSFTRFDPLRARDVWIDLIFEQPRDATIRIDDVTLLRHPRANF